MLFIIYLNDIDIGLQNNIYKFADDSKIAGRVSDVNGTIELQRDLDKLISWADRWQMEFNIDKCKVVHMLGEIIETLLMKCRDSGWNLHAESATWV